MKRREALQAPVKRPKKWAKKNITAQTTEHLLVLDIWTDKKCTMRHVMNISTGEYETYYVDTKEWTTENLTNAVEMGDYWGYGISEKEYILSKEDAEIIQGVTENTWRSDAYGRVCSMEVEYSRNREENKRESRERRLKNLMDLCKAPGKEVYEWVANTVVNDLQYAFYGKEKDSYHCTACNQDFQPAAGVKMRNRDSVTCPLCGHAVTVCKRGDRVTVKTRLTIIENMDEERGVERHFNVEIAWQDKRTVYLEEIIRLTMLRNIKKEACKLYYNDGWGSWTTGNRANKRWNTGYLYPDTEAIRAGLKGTAYEAWSDVLPQLAQAGIYANYNNLLVESNIYFTRMTEYLFKGRFFRLLTETSESIAYWNGYRGGLHPGKDTIEGVMGLQDRQLINRIRQENGGANMHAWLQWSEYAGRKISTECLNWMEKAGISVNRYQRSIAQKHMTPEKLMHYIIRQKNESYKGRKESAIFESYEDYLDMCIQLGKHMDDEMVYRPRELKRRHDEATEECNRRKEELQKMRDAEKAKRDAEKMREKYPGYEDILQEVKQKYEYAGEKYLIMVPKDFAEITAEGMALHHCVGNTERYFDRIVSRETYICFLRQQSSPEEPFYTIEVEPGGTIRQHRGAYDEEPGIEEIKPFLREWQKVIRKRMSHTDHEYAKNSAVLRQKNIEELQAKNNTRVLEGLMEDLMEVI